MDEKIKVLGFAGSLRKGSYNRALLRVAKGLVPEGMELEIFELDDIPLYNGDVEEQGFPEPVQEFQNKIREVDALLVVTPEYNYSIPGVLKNAIDWASRPPTNCAIVGKPVAVTGASTGRFGTLRSQLHLRDVFLALNMPAVLKPEVYITNAEEKFDGNGNLTDERSISQIRKLLQSLADLTIKMKGGEGKQAVA